LFRQLAEFVPKCLKITGGPSTPFAELLTACRAAIPTQTKMALIDETVLHESRRINLTFHVRFNRYSAAAFRARAAKPSAMPLLQQLIGQLENDANGLRKLNKTIVPWHVELTGEGATDIGGPGRDLFSEVCREISDPMLGLFCPSPNMRRDEGEQVLIPNPAPVEPGSPRETMYFYAGVLFSMCFISRLPQPFRFAKFVWDALTGRPVAIEDIYNNDAEFERFIKAITLDGEYMFTVQNSAGDMVDLITKGSAIHVTHDRCSEFRERCIEFRVHEFATQLDAMRRGFNEFFDASIASLLTASELELLVCGPQEVPIDELMKNCQVDDSPHARMLWRVLETFTTEERMKFIKFGCGRMSLPPPGMAWGSKLRIEFRDFPQMSDRQQPLPTAATCVSQMRIPKYGSEEVMAHKIRLAINHGTEIDQDHEAAHTDVRHFT
jgi:E3 ubiquitin-protein ligase HERC1